MQCDLNNFCRYWGGITTFLWGIWVWREKGQKEREAAERESARIAESRRIGDDSALSRTATEDIHRGNAHYGPDRLSQRPKGPDARKGALLAAVGRGTMIPIRDRQGGPVQRVRVDVRRCEMSWFTSPSELA
jgi:hypothetical protein